MVISLKFWGGLSSLYRIYALIYFVYSQSILLLAQRAISSTLFSLPIFWGLFGDFLPLLILIPLKWCNFVDKQSIILVSTIFMFFQGNSSSWKLFCSKLSLMWASFLWKKIRSSVFDFDHSNYFPPSTNNSQNIPFHVNFL